MFELSVHWLVVGLDAGTASLKQSSLAIEWSKALTVAEAGLNDSITRLGESRSATNPCNMSTSTVCTGGGGQYQVSWTQTGSKIVVTSISLQSPENFETQLWVRYGDVVIDVSYDSSVSAHADGYDLAGKAKAIEAKLGKTAGG